VCAAAVFVIQSAVAQSTSTPAGTWVVGDTGETLIVPMANAPYPHESRKDGFKSRDKVFPRDPHYVDNSVGIFIPKGYKGGEATDLLFYFHGHSNNIRKAFDMYKLREQIAASGKNVIAVFPEGPKDAGDSGCGKLDEKNGLKRLADEVLDRLAADGKIKSRKLGRVLLAGHSGAYSVISLCLQFGGVEEHISDVCLLDAAYAQLDGIVDWVARRSTGRLFSIFTDHLAARNVYLMTHLRQRDIRCELLAEQDAKAPIVRDSRAIFLYAEKLDHNGTVQWLQRWLAGTSLPNR
jgi:hypothetical protein